jgi:glucosyl-dolichyl phosphate glucuronosyltransferase
MVSSIRKQYSEAVYMQSDLLSVSVITCAYTEHRWDDLVACIESIRSQVKKPCEIIVAIDHNETLYKHAREYFPKEVQFIQNFEERGLSGARNSGISIAKGDVIAFLDDDAVAEPEWLDNLCEIYRDPAVMGVGGAILPYWQSGKPAWFPDEFNWVVGCTYRGVSEKPAPIRNLIGCNMSFRTNVFENVGGFRSGIGRIGTLPYGCEETELCIRANQKFPANRFMYEPLARVSHLVPGQRTKFSYFLRRCYAEGISKAIITNLIGGQDGLSSERAYTFKTLPEGVLRGIYDAVHGDLSGFGRAVAIVVGFSFTVLGYLFGKIYLFFQPGSYGTGKRVASI